MSRQKVVILGCGFAALTAARSLRRQAADLEICIVAKRPELQYLPSLIWIPSGLRHRSDVILPLDRFFQRNRIAFHQAEVTGLSDDARVVHTSAGDVTNDGLVIGTGGRFIKKLPGIEHAITPCEGIDAAEHIRERVQSMAGGTIAVGFAGNPSEQSAVRGGPMFEFLFGLDTQLRQEGRRNKFKLVFFNPSKEPGARLGPKSVAHLLREMSRKGIETQLGHKMVRFESDRVVTEGGEFAADLILFMPGMTGNAWFDATTLPRSPGGLIQAGADCRVLGFERVMVAGDSGSFPGPDWMPKQAHMADLQAKVAATNLLADLEGRPSSQTFKVELMCIVDALDKGTLIWRTPGRNILLPPNRLMHWLKRFFERTYLAQYR